MYTFENCNEWINNFEYDKQNQKVYAICDRSVYVLDMKYRAAVGYIPDAHESPLTKCIWYDVDQFYITACTRGIIRCYSPNHVADMSNVPSVHPHIASPPHTLLHTIIAHSKGITGLALHPSPFQFISSGQDGYIKVFSLETFENLQIFCTNESISTLSLIGHRGRCICLFGHDNGDIVQWKVQRYGTLFKSGAEKLETFEMCVAYRPKKKTGHSDNQSSSKPQSAQNQILGMMISNLQQMAHPPSQMSKSSRSRGAGSAMRGVGSRREKNRSRQSNADGGQTPNGAVANSSTEEDATATSHFVHGSQVQDDTHGSNPNGIMTTPLITVVNNDNFSGGPTANYDACIVTMAGHDINVVGLDGANICRIEPEQLIEEVLLACYSVSQKLLFCIVDSGHLRIFCMRHASGITLRSALISSLGNDVATGLTLIPGMSLGQLRSPISKDMRGNLSPINAMEALVITTSGGTILFQDTYHECALIAAHQAFQGKIEKIRYKYFTNEIFVLGNSSLKYDFFSIKIISILPALALTHEIKCDDTFSSWKFSPTMEYLAVGCSDGMCRFYGIIPPPNAGKKTRFVPTTVNLLTMSRDVKEQGSFTEYMRQEDSHSSAVVDITFCDALKIYATGSTDMTVKIWNYEKRYIKTIVFDCVPSTLLFINDTADLLISQQCTIVKITRGNWDKNSIASVEGRDKEDIWQQDTDPVTAPPEVAKQQGLYEMIVQQGKSAASSKHSRLTGKSAPSRDAHTGHTFVTETAEIAREGSVSCDEDEDRIDEVKDGTATLAPKQRNFWSSSEFDFDPELDVERRARESECVVFDVRKPSFVLPEKKKDKSVRHFIPGLYMMKKLKSKQQEMQRIEEDQKVAEELEPVVHESRRSSVGKLSNQVRGRLHQAFIQSNNMSERRSSNVAAQITSNHQPDYVNPMNATIVQLRGAGAARKISVQLHHDQEMEEDLFIRVNGPREQDSSKRRAQKHRRAVLEKNT